MAGHTSTNTYGVAKWVVSPDASQGTHTTIAAANASASSGDTIFIRDGTYTESFTLTPGVSFSSLGGNDQSTNVTVNLTATMTGAGTCVFYGMNLIANAAPIITINGTSASVVIFEDCNLSIGNNTGIDISSSSSSSQVDLFRCFGSVGASGTLHTSSSAGNINYRNCNISSSSSNAATNSSGNVNLYYSNFNSPLTSSSTGGITIYACGLNCSSTNSTCVTIGGSGNGNAKFVTLNSGSSPSLIVNNSFTLQDSAVISSAVAQITGSGTLTYIDVSGAKNITVTSQTGGTLPGSSFQNPTAGYLGEIGEGSATGVSLTSTSATNVVSHTFQPGIWDISCLCQATNTGVNLSSLTVTITSTSTGGSSVTGDTSIISSTLALGNVLTGVVPPLRIVLTAATTYYCVATAVFAAGTTTAIARLSATRVG